MTEDRSAQSERPGNVQAISAVTLATRDMSRAVAFYRALGFELCCGGEDSDFTSFRAGRGFLNLIPHPADGPRHWWGRIIFHVSDVDAFYERALAAGLQPATRPADAPWGERYFHIIDADGHELSLARPLPQREPAGS